jgi:cell filamentation protein
MSEYFTSYDDVLENKLGISDPKALKQLEEEIVPFRTAEIFSSFLSETFDFRMLKRIHSVMFSDLYQMAGQVRSVDMVRGDNKIPFCFTQNIESEQKRIFDTLKREHNFRGLERAEFIKKLAWLAGELNALHPFRDGNGRAIRAFLVLLAQNADYELDYSRVDKDELIEADVRAFMGDMEALERVYGKVTC